MCGHLFSVHSTPVLLQWHIKNRGHSAKSVGDRLHWNTHPPLTQQSWSVLTMLLSRMIILFMFLICLESLYCPFCIFFPLFPVFSVWVIVLQCVIVSLNSNYLLLLLPPLGTNTNIILIILLLLYYTIGWIYRRNKPTCYWSGNVLWINQWSKTNKKKGGGGNVLPQSSQLAESLWKSGIKCVQTDLYI